MLSEKLYPLLKHERARTKQGYATPIALARAHRGCSSYRSIASSVMTRVSTHLCECGPGLSLGSALWDEIDKLLEVPNDPAYQ